MKASEIKEMNLEEMQLKKGELEQELFNLRFQHEIGQLENPQRMKQIKKDVARLNTIIREVDAKNKAAEE
jgi:large subunit ribosomal protein L29